MNGLVSGKYDFFSFRIHAKSDLFRVLSSSAGYTDNTINTSLNSLCNISNKLAHGGSKGVG